MKNRILIVAGIIINLIAILFNCVALIDGTKSVISSFALIALNTAACTLLAKGYWISIGRPGISEIIAKIPFKIVK